MTVLTLAAKNVRASTRSYAAFFLSSSFAVWLFYLYAMLTDHPQINTETVPEAFRQALVVVQWVVVLFSVLFVLYAHSAFLKGRQKQLGLLTLLGLKPGQIAGMIHGENLLIGTAAITTGVGVGTISAKLLFLLVGRLLGLPEPMAFRISWPAIGVTYLVFLVIFAVVSLLGQLTLRRLSLAELFRSGARPKVAPHFSWWLASLSLLLIGGAYGLTLTLDPSKANQLIWWIAGMGLGGTYLLFTQASVALLKWLRNRRAVYWRQTNLIILSQMAYKVRDNARILFMVSTISTLVLLFICTGYTAYSRADSQAEKFYPVGVMLVGEQNGVGPGEVTAALEQHGDRILGMSQLPVLLAGFEYTRPDGTTVPSAGLGIAPVSAVNDWRRQVLGLEPLALADGKAMFLGGDANQMTAPEISFGFGNLSNPSWKADRVIPIDQAESGYMVNANSSLDWLLVVDDTFFADLHQQYGNASSRILHGWRLANWHQSADALNELLPLTRDARSELGGRQFDRLTGTVVMYRDLVENAAVLLFLLGFLALLFFLAAGNMLYFKLFTDLNEERRQYEALQKIGLRSGEVGRIISVQTLILFFLPLAVAAVHVSVFARMIGRVLKASVWAPMVTVVGVYLLLQVVYFLAARRTYMRAVTMRA
ncbi:MAG TPA: FtsX-like permease family protein [Symbiobacteriaceae bacterium]|nr:FtsX-like permease family protein [Symbiobacteriaceae bacterium]